MDFDINDGSLGQYLNFTYFTPCEGGENMNYDTCTIKSTVDYDKISGGAGNPCVTSTGYTVTYDANSTAGNLYYSTGAGECYNYSTSIAYPYFDEEKCREIVKDELKKEKEMTTNNLVKNFNFGPVSDNHVRMSPYGLAISTSAGTWVAYNAANSEVIDVTEFNFNMSKWIYAMPVALSAIAAGDILVHNGKYVFVREVNNDGTINVLDYVTSSVMNILPVKSPFGFNFYTKICPLVDISNMTANADNPFGNMLPFLLMGEGKDFDPMMLMLMNGNTDFTSNPMMMYALMKGDNGKIDPIVMMMMNNFCGK